MELYIIIKKIEICKYVWNYLQNAQFIIIWLKKHKQL